MIFLLLFSQGGVISVEAAGNEADFQIINNSTGVTITGYTGHDVDLEIPEYIQSKPVTEIGDGAFYGRMLKTVKMSDSVISIGEWAFAENNLESVELSSGLTSIGSYSFFYNRLTAIKIPASVKTIGQQAFYYNKLERVELSEGIETIEDGAFWDNHLMEIEIPDSVIFMGDWVFRNNNIKSIKLPATSISIGDSVFANNQLQHIDIPLTVQTIGDWAFLDNDLTSIDIPASVNSIGDEAFAYNQLHTVRFHGALTLGDDIFIEQGTPQFDGWYEDKSYTQAWNNQVLNAIEIYTKDTPAASSVIYHGNGATAGATPVDATAYKEGDSVTVQEEGNLAKTDHTFTGWNTQANGNGTSYAVGDTFNIETENIILYAQWAGIQSYGVFYNENGATEGTAPIDTLAYQEGDSVTVKEKGNLAKANYIFTGWNTQPNGNGTSYAVGDIFNVGTENITLYAQWEEVGNEDDFQTIDNATGVTIIGYVGNEGIDLMIPPFINAKPVTAIGDRAFFQKYLTAVDIPATVTSIGESAFETNDLAYLELPNSVISIGDKAFADNFLMEVLFKMSLTSIGNEAFRWNDLEELELPMNLLTIGDQAFKENQLISVELPDSLTSIGAQAFSSNQLTALRIPANVTFIGERAFFWNDLKQVDIQATNLTSIENGVFRENKLESIDLPDSVLTIGERAFGFNEFLEHVKLPANLQTIGDYAFQFNVIKDLVIPNSVTTIGKNAFHINKIERLMIPSSVTTIGEGAFLNNDLQAVRFCGAPALGEKAFAEQNPDPADFEWYEDTNYTKLWNGVVAKPMKIYAEGAPNLTTYSVTYEENGAIGTVPEGVDAYEEGECVTVAHQGDLVKGDYLFTR